MAACTARRLREQDFNCVPNAIGVDLITTIIACTGIQTVDTDKERERIVRIALYRPVRSQKCHVI